MLHFFQAGGPLMWPLMIIFLLILVLVIKKVIELFLKQEPDQQRMESGINAIIFWGGMGLVLGFYAHFQGIYNAMNAIARASDISPAIVAMGYAMSLTTILFGMLIFLVAALSWFLLRWKYKKIITTAKFSG